MKQYIKSDRKQEQFSTASNSLEFTPVLDEITTNAERVTWIVIWLVTWLVTRGWGQNN